MVTDKTHPAGRNELPERPSRTPASRRRTHPQYVRELANALARVTGLNWETDDFGNTYADRGRFTVGVGPAERAAAAPGTWTLEVWTADGTGRILASRELRPHRLTVERFAAIVGPIALVMLDEVDAAGAPHGDGRKGVQS